jgi:Uma2 family endonuclease
MERATLVSAEEYLSNVYEPDMDYVDGELEDRNVGEKDHAKLQFKVAKILDSRGIWFVTIGTRTKISPTRYRVPDVSVYAEEPDEQVFITPPLLIIEILSPEDRMSRMQRKMEDYFGMGCRNVWVLDPWRKKAYQYDGTALIEAQGELTTDNRRLSISLAEVFRA